MTSLLRRRDGRPPCDVRLAFNHRGQPARRIWAKANVEGALKPEACHRKKNSSGAPVLRISTSRLLRVVFSVEGLKALRSRL